MRPLVAQWLAAERLPSRYADTALPVVERLAGAIAQRAARSRLPLIVGLQGAQGSGKSTMASLLDLLLCELHGLSAARLSLDDLYLGRAERAQIARDVHPLFVTRGVPGTHDVGMGMALIDALREGQMPLALPRFSKALDECEPRERWPVMHQPPDVLIFEGWCVGVPPQSDAALVTPVNALEAQEDPDGIWRRAVNARLGSDYAQLFARIDLQIMLCAPGFEQVAGWRLRQEQRLPGGSMDGDAVARFVAHYERLTRHALVVMPDLADIVIDVLPDQTPVWRTGKGE